MRRLFIYGGGLAVALLIFHGPILRHLTRGLAIHFAAKKNLKLDFQIEGSILGGITLKKLHGITTGASTLESIEADRIHADYSFLALIFHGPSAFLKNIEVDSAAVVLNPKNTPPASPPKPNEKFRLPTVFPERLQLSHVTLTIRGEPRDTVLQNLTLDLDPLRAGRLHIDQLQLPNIHTWANINAATSYANKDLFIRNLTLDSQDQFQIVNIDASKIGSGQVSLQIDGSLGGGLVHAAADLRANRKTIAVNVKLNAANVSLASLTESFAVKSEAMAGNLKEAQVEWHGVLDQPKTWRGNIAAQLEHFRRDKLELDQVNLEVRAANGVAALQGAQIDAANNHIRLRGSAELPATFKEFGRTPANLQLDVDAADLKQLTSFLRQPATGSVRASGQIKIENATMQMDLTAHGALLGIGNATIKDFAARIVASKKIPAPNETYANLYQELTSAIHAQLSELRYGDYEVDNVQADLKSDGAVVSFAPVTVTRKANQLIVRGNYQLPPADGKFIDQPGDIVFFLNAPQLADYWKNGATNKITGRMETDGQVHLRRGLASGALKLFGTDIATRKLLVRQLSAQAAITDNIVYLNDFTAAMNKKDYVAASGTVRLQWPFRYTGQLLTNLTDLSEFQSLLGAGGAGKPLAGSLVVNWHGKGEAGNFRNEGDLSLKLQNGRFADLQNLRANVEASYTPEGFKLPIIFLGSDKMDFQATAQAQGDTLEVSKIQIDQGQAKYATGYLSLPFVWRNLGTERPLFAPDGQANVTFQSENLDLKKLFEDFGATAPLAGMANVKITAQGPMANLRGQLDLQLRGLRVEKFANLDPASFDLGAHVENNQLALTGKLQQAKIQPVTIEAHMPLNVARVIEAKKLDEATAISAKISLPRSPVNFVRQFVPAVEEIDGNLAADVNVNGTIGHPILSGNGDMTVNIMRFSNATLPTLSGFKARLVFNRDTVSLEQFGGELAGGKFTVSGRVAFPQLTKPTIDLQLKANSVLVARNDSLTARADADVRANGPLTSASVTGNVALTNSEFLKNIDLIPIGLPGRPAPQPPESRPVLTFPDPLLRDWKFDVAIKTKDPFLIRGNLASGGAIVDLKLSGTGLRPGLQGIVRLKNVEATLPFSRLEIAYGYLYFEPDDPLNPKIDLHGTSLIQDYTVNVYVYGTSLDPQAIFSSEPPLPQEDIISLLATGTTRQELTGSNNVLAGRAAMLLIQQLYRKVFKKGQATQSNSVFDRLQVNLGDIDPKTGQQTATARFKIDQHFVLVGDIEVGGDFRGMVKYLLRFR